MGRGMRAGKKQKVGGGGGNMQQQLKQMQAMQRQMEAMQEELEAKEFTTTSGGGAVSVTANGKREIVNLTIDKDVVDPDDVEMLQDLILAATNEAMKMADDASANMMGRMTGGMGGGFPF